MGNEIGDRKMQAGFDVNGQDALYRTAMCADLVPRRLNPDESLAALCKVCAHGGSGENGGRR